MILLMKTTGLGMHFVATSQVHGTNQDATTCQSVDTKMSNNLLELEKIQVIYRQSSSVVN
jgi:hypothetical protein